MSSEVPVKPEPAGESAETTPAETAATAPAQTETTPIPAKTADAPKPDPDWKAAFTGLQGNLERLHRREEDLLRQNQAMASAMSAQRTDTRELIRATGGDEAVKASAAREAALIAQNAQQRAADASLRLMTNMANVIGDLLEANGIARDDKSIDWMGNGAADPDEWYRRVSAQATAKVREVNEARVAKERGAIQRASNEEIKAEAEARTQRALKEQGVDKIDTAKGGASTSFLDRLRAAQKAADNGDPSAFNRMIEDGKAGRLRT